MLLDLDLKESSKLAVIDSDNATLSYGQLTDFIELLAEKLPARSFVFVMSTNNIGSVVWSIGLMGAHHVPLLLNSKMDPYLLGNLRSEYQPNYICVEEDQVALFQLPIVMRAYGYALLRASRSKVEMSDELSHLLPTSGSTGSPKLVRHSYLNIYAQGRNIASFFELTPNDLPLLVLPLYYTMGLSVVFSHLAIGATILITNLSMTDRKFWDFFKTQKATSFTGVPYSYEILRMMRFDRLGIDCLNLLTQGGGRLSETVNRYFVDYCDEHHIRWIATYGQTEGTARMAYLPPELAEIKLGSIGRAIPEGELFLLDEQGERIDKAHRQGRLYYKGPNVTLGYAQHRCDLALGDSFGKCLATGDLAYFDNDGCYFITGRESRFLKLYGARIGLDDCEELIKNVYQIDSACTGDDRCLYAYITDPYLFSDVRRLLIQKTGIMARAIQVKVVDCIPKNESGKILYSLLS